MRRRRGAGRPAGSRACARYRPTRPSAAARSGLRDRDSRREYPSPRSNGGSRSEHARAPRASSCACVRDLGFAHVRLVERIDAERRAGDRRREFPAEELRAELAGRRRRCGRPDGRPLRGRAPAYRRTAAPGVIVDDERAIGPVFVRRRRAARRRSAARRGRPCRCSRRRAVRSTRRAAASVGGRSSVSLSRPAIGVCRP